MKSNLIYLACVLILLGLYVAAPYAQTFTRIDTSIITRDGGYTQGSSWGDFDNDGDEDLFISNGSVTNGSHRNFLYRNEGRGRFTKITVGDIVNETSTNGGGGACWGDYDNDGDLDLFFPVFYGINSRLYRNEGNGSLTKITTGIIVNDNSGDSVGSSWVDIDNDGDLDLFVANDTSHPNFLYRNEGNGNFSKITEGLIVTEGLSSLSGSWTDIDNDGGLDLFVANIENDRLYINHGNGSFANVTTGDIVNDGRFSASGSWADYDNDGDMDLYVATFDGTNLLYRNNGGGLFQKIMSSAVVTDSAATASGSWGDYDNDGDLDLFVTTYQDKNFFYRNDGGGSFSKVTTGAIVNDQGGSGSVSDYDNDGDLDILVTNGFFGAPFENYLYSNDGNNNHWINIKCIGKVSNRTAIGARVKAKATISGKAVWQMREIAQQTGYGGHNSLRVHFGFGDATVIDSLIIRWPSKIMDVYTHVRVNQFINVVEGQNLTAIAEKNVERPSTLTLNQNYPNPFNPSTTIHYALPTAQFVTLKIFNLAGQELATLVHRQQIAGEHAISWNAEKVPSGVYLYRLQAGEFSETKKMILMR